jgi:hypothetical protein
VTNFSIWFAFLINSCALLDNLDSNYVDDILLHSILGHHSIHALFSAGGSTCLPELQISGADKISILNSMLMYEAAEAVGNSYMNFLSGIHQARHLLCIFQFYFAECIKCSVCGVAYSLVKMGM